MIRKATLYCEARNIEVEALLDKQGAPVVCTAMTKCSRSLFCRFVNPLTTRVPLVPPAQPAPAK